MLRKEAHGLAASGDVSTRWEAIAAKLRDDIRGGHFVAGERLPNESDLARRFGVNRHTLRQAMQSLARDGHVDVVQGSGTFVRELVLDYALKRRTRMTENLASVGERAHREVLFDRVAQVGDFGIALGLGKRHEAEWLATRASVRGRIVSVSTAVFPIPRLSGMADAVRKFGTITEAFRSLGILDYTRARSAVSARLPSRSEADFLARPMTQPVLAVHYTNVDGDGVPIEAGTTLFAADAVQLTVDDADLS
jgi:GntR family phosphonate transport system transcriptional regulator